MSVLSDLEKLHSAEDFFSYLKVDYDPAVLRVARLHILKRMGKYLAGKDFSGASRGPDFRGARETLAQAYQRLRRLDARSTSASSRFLQEHDPSRPATADEAAPKAFVPLDQLTIIGR